MAPAHDRALRAGLRRQDVHLGVAGTAGDFDRRSEGYPGATRATSELIEYWRRDGREWPLFFAQLEAAEPVH